MNRHAPERHACAAFVLAATMAAVSASAQCAPDWLPGTGVPGIQGTVHASVMWDPDGEGGQPARLVVGGNFTLADSTVVSNIAAWDGTSWSALGDGFDAAVNALTVWQGQLVAGGAFSASGATTLGRVAKWNGTTWSRFNSGTTIDLAITSNSVVNALAAPSNGDLIAGGSLTAAGTNTTGTVPVGNLARWNGAEWGPNNPTGTQKGVSSAVNVLAIASDGDLLAGGTFTSAGTDATVAPLSITANRIVRFEWSGSDWLPQALGTGAGSTVSAIATDGADIIIGGSFTTPGTRVARWSNATSSWGAIGAGVADQPVQAVAVMPNGDIIAGGAFANSGGNYLRSLIRWDGSNWSQLWPADVEGANPLNATQRTVRSLLVRPDGTLVIGGQFKSAGNGVAANAIASWNGTTFSPISNGAASTSSFVTAMTRLSSGDVIAGGGFLSIQGTAANQVARWNGSSWSAMSTGLFPADNPHALPEYKQPITSIAEMSNGDIVVGGMNFAVTDGGERTPIARWNGSVWSLFSPNLAHGETTPPPFATESVVSALLPLPDNKLYVGGNAVFFQGNPGTPRYLVHWDGAQWTDTNAFTNNMTRTLHILSNTGGPDSGKLVLGGGTPIDGVANANYIAQWDRVTLLAGTDSPAWEPLGKGANTIVNQILPLANGDFVAVGQFATVGNAAANDTTANRIAGWNRATQTWSTFNFGLNGIVHAIVQMPNGDLVVGGEFTAAGNAAAGDTPANRIARWNGSSWSAFGEGLNGAVLSLAVDANGNLLVGGLFTTAGSGVSANIARWGCPVVVCAADFNGVNGVTVQDIFDFLTAWLAGSPTANFNGVNGVTVQDIFDFLTAWLAGC